MRSVAAVLLLACVTSAEEYVQYQAKTQTNTPPGRALASAVLQNTVASTAALGRFVWMFGGLGTALNPLNDLWKLDLQTTTWTSQAPYGPAPAQRRGASLTLAEQRVAYLFGGESSSNAVLNDLHLLHLGPGSSDGQPTPRWELITANVSGSGMPLARTEHSCTAAPLLNVGPGTDGMLLFGGVDNAGNALDDLHSLQFATLFWRTPNPSGVKPQKRKGHTTVLLLNSILALYGGSNPQTPVHYSDVHLLDIARNTWIQPALVSANNAPVGRDGHSMVTIGDVVYIFGGVSSQGEKLSDLWSFNAYAAVSGQLRWSKPVGMSSAPVPRWGHVGVGYAGDSMAIISGSGAGDLLLTDMHVISTGCSGDLSLTAARGVFSDGDGKYRNNLDCRWKIQPTLANTYVRVVVTQLELLDAGDKLEVYDGDALTSPLLASYTGSSIPPSLISSGKKLMVRLVTDAAGENGEGFQAAYQAVCAPGFTWDSVSASCKACPAGSYAGIAASTECTACPVGFYAPLPGAGSCLQCPAYATTSQPGAYLLQACSCQPGYYGWNNECRVCSDGGSCPGGNLVAASPGWCETTNTTGYPPSFAHCCEPRLCPGGLNARCDASVGLVGEASCSVRTISWDTLGLVSLTTGTWVTFVLIIILAMLICFCTGLSLGVRRAVRQLENVVVPVTANSPKKRGSTPVLKDTPRAEPPTFTAVEKLTDDPRGRAEQSVDAPGAGIRDPANDAPQPPMRTPDYDPAGRPPAPQFQRGESSASYVPSYAPRPLMHAGSYSSQSMMPPSYERGGSMADEEVLVVSLDDAARLGSTAPPPQLQKAQSSSRAMEAEAPEPASPGGGGGDDDGASVAPTESDAGGKKKKKKSKKAESGDEAEEEDEDGGKKKKKSKDGDNKKKKSKKGSEDEAEEGDEDGDGEKKKKKKKSKE